MEKVEVHIDPSLLKEKIVENITFRSFCDFRLTESDCKKACTELGETEKKISNCLKELKKMLSGDRRMRYRLDDDYLLRFLRFRKFDVKKTYKFIHNFYTMRNENPEVFTLPSDIEDKLKANFTNSMPYKNGNGGQVYIIRMSHWNYTEMNMHDLCNVFSYVSDLCTMNPHAQIHGVIDVFDFRGITAGHLSVLLNPASVRFWMKFIQEIYPWRIKKLILFNCNAILYSSISVLRFFLKKKIAKRIIVLQSDLKELHEHINPEVLPKEYGGHLEDEEAYSYFPKFVLSNKEYYRYENSFIGYKN